MSEQSHSYYLLTIIIILVFQNQSIENTIPGSGYVLGALLGPVMEPLPPKPVTKDVGLMKKKLDREKKKKKEEEVAPAVTEGEAAKLGEVYIEKKNWI